MSVGKEKNADMMQKELVQGRRGIHTKEMIFCGVFTALIAIGAFIKIPVPVCPFTLQFLFTMMAGLLLGGKLGSLSVIVYIVLGLIGLPVFAEGGGFWYVLKPTFGYLIGFAIGAYVTGKMIEQAKKLTLAKYLLANFTGLVIMYATGMVYYFVISNYVIDTPIGLWPLFLYCFLLAIPGDIALCILAAFLAKGIWTTIRRIIED